MINLTLPRYTTTLINKLPHLGQCFGVLAVCVLLSGCDQGDPNADGGGASSGSRNFVTVGTAPEGGAFSVVGNAITNAIDQNQGDLNWVLSAQGTKGTQENIRKLDSGEIEFGMANAAISYFANRGEGDWDRSYKVRAVGTLAPNVGVFVTTEGTGITKLADLKGKRVVLGPAGAGFEYFLQPLLKAHGLTYDDMTVLNGNYLAAGDMLKDGKADAAFMGGATPIPAITSLCSTQDVVFIKLDPDTPEKLKEYPFYFPVPVAPEAYSDLDEELLGINVGNMQMLTYADVDEGLVYQFTKLMYENREAIATMHPAGKAINPKNVVRDTGTPFHPGAIKYYKEAGIWPAQ